MKPDAHERRREFCARIKTERQRRDRSLLDIASATKVQASLLEAFERGDLSKWPKGIYRRAFFRDYVTAIGLPAGQHVAEFLELFPDADALPLPSATAHVAVEAPPAPLRIMLADNTAPWTPRRTDARTLQWHTTLRRSGTAAADLLAVVLVALLLSPWTSGLWAAIGIVACVYYPVSTALLGRTPASALLVRRKWTVAVAAASALAAQLRIRLLEVMARAPELRACIEQASQSAVLKKAPAVLKNARARLVRLSRWRPQTRRDRELAALRQRRIEAAKRSNDKISEVLG